MKQFFLSAMACLGAATAAHAGPDQSSRTFIPDPLDVPAFVPPKPAVVKRLPSIRIDSSVIVPSAGSHTLTVQRGEASTRPDLPPPPPPAPAKPALDPTPEQLARQLYGWRHSINLGATVYNHKVSEVHWTDQETGTYYQAICGFDIGLIAGIGKFVHDGENYAVSLLHTDYDTAISRKSAARAPEIASGQIALLKGDPKDANATIVLYLIRDLIASEKDRLLTYQADRSQRNREAAAWAAAHPVAPRDETIRLRPHRGSRYLANPQSGEQGGTAR